QYAISKRRKIRKSNTDENEDDRDAKRKMPFPKVHLVVNLLDDVEIEVEDMQILANVIDLTRIDKEPERQTEKNEVIDLMIGDEDASKPSRISEDEKIIETVKLMVPEINNDILRVIFKHIIDDIFENILKDENVGKEAGSIMCTDRRFNILFTEVFFKELDYYVKKMRVFETVSLPQIEDEKTNDIENTELLESLPEIEINKNQAATEYIYMILEDIMIRDDCDIHIFAMIKKVFSLEALEKNGLQDMLRKKYQEKVLYKIDVIGLLKLWCVVNDFVRLLHDSRPEYLYLAYID
ncbi:2708_t:CDS:2, partial [Racocetra fulgida]